MADSLLGGTQRTTLFLGDSVQCVRSFSPADSIGTMSSASIAMVREYIKKKSPKMTNVFTLDEIKAKKQDGFVGLAGNVWDLSKFADEHPGGAELVRDVVG